MTVGRFPRTYLWWAVGIGSLAVLVCMVGGARLAVEALDPQMAPVGAEGLSDAPADARRMLWVSDHAPTTPSCTVFDQLTGEPLRVEPTARYHHDSAYGYLAAFARFRTTEGEVRVECGPGDAQVYLGAAYDERWFAGHALWVFVVPGALGLIAGAVLLLGFRRRR